MTTIKRDSRGGLINNAFSWPCTEPDLLYLNVIFTTKGIHHIRVSDELSGRLLIKNVLASLQWYYQVACITTSDDTVDFADNVVARLPKPLDDMTIEQFFLEEFYYDFVWIELTEELKREDWIENFQERIHAFQIDLIIPVIVIEYIH